ncbi:uncharacterized protein LOC111335895 [Stylophora pistillata]|uniref:uncharacterized protein LOC111335895 n=1 Tax=Stylophora pistillata TaxID=50429 RepID=UPI000C03E151|nr:uncharacterized protein LOC111335895 [Stylophora pistillata]
MRKEMTELDNKIKLLKLKITRTDEIILKRDRQALERPRSSITSIVSAVDELKLTIEEGKISKGESEEEIALWGKGIEDDLKIADNTTKRIQDAIKAVDLEEQEQEAIEKHNKNMKFERQLLEQRAEFETAREDEKVAALESGQQNSSVAAKLTKLSITKFSGRVRDWLPLWGKFKSEIDSSNLARLTKFVFLKELLEKHVRNDIEGLPFTDEGCDSARAILEAEYGQQADIVNVYMKNIMELPVITGGNPKKVKEFYKQLRYNVQSLDTLERFGDVRGNVRSTLEKLRGVKADLVRGNEGWRDWDFKDLLRELKKWSDISPVEESTAEKIPSKGVSHSKQTTPTSVFKTHSQQETRTGNQRCGYCEDQNHRSVNCTKVTETGKRRRILAEKRLCFNCTGGKHRADECKSRLRCQKCSRKHHTSICNARENEFNPLLVAAGMPNARVTYPVVVVEVEGVKCRALLDTGAGSSYASAALLNRIPTRKRAKEVRKIEMLLGT